MAKWGTVRWTHFSTLHEQVYLLALWRGNGALMDCIVAHCSISRSQNKGVEQRKVMQSRSAHQSTGEKTLSRSMQTTRSGIYTSTPCAWLQGTGYERFEEEECKPAESEGGRAQPAAAAAAAKGSAPSPSRGSRRQARRQERGAGTSGSKTSRACLFQRRTASSHCHRRCLPVTTAHVLLNFFI